MEKEVQKNYRLDFFECLAIMRETFLTVAKVDSPEIQNYLEANNKAHDLLAKIVSNKKNESD